MRGTTAVGATLSLLLLLVSCGPEDESRDGELAPLRRLTIPKGLGGPSGLVMVEGTLHVVGDEAPRVLELTPFAVEVDRLSVDAVCGDDEGFEAVAYDGEALLVACEPSGEILRVDSQSGAVLGRFAVDGLADQDSGIEGLAAGADGQMFAAREKNPSVLVQLDAGGRELGRVRLDFSADVSGLGEVCAAGCPEQLLVVSQEERRVYQIDTSGEVLGEWAIGATRPEGIACDDAALYVVDEETRELLVFDFPGRCL